MIKELEHNRDIRNIEFMDGFEEYFKELPIDRVSLAMSKMKNLESINWALYSEGFPLIEHWIIWLLQFSQLKYANVSFPEESTAHFVERLTPLHNLCLSGGHL